MRHRTVAVVDSSGYSTLIEGLAGLRVLALDSGNPRQTESDLRTLPADVGAIFLPHATTDEACRARALTGGPPVLTQDDTSAITIAAELLIALTRAGRPPRSRAVVIIGADDLPILCPLLMVCRFGSVTTWNASDAHAFPLDRVIAGADAVVDLRADAMNGGMRAPQGGPVVVAPKPEHAVPLVLPGLLRAIIQTPRCESRRRRPPRLCARARLGHPARPPTSSGTEP